MRHLADQPGRGVARQPRVGVEGDDVTHAFGHPWRRPVGTDEAGVGGAAQQTVQLMQLAPLALPPHPDALAGIVAPLSMEQQEARARRARRVPQVQGRNLSFGLRQQDRVGGQGFLRGIEPVGQKGKTQIAAAARQVVHLQPLDLLAQVCRAGQQRRHRHQRAQRRGHAGFQLEPGQQGCPQRRGHRAVDQRLGHLGGGQDRGEDPEREPRRRGRQPQRPDRQRQQQPRRPPGSRRYSRGYPSAW